MPRLIQIVVVIAAGIILYKFQYYYDAHTVRKASGIFVTDAANEIATHWNVPEFVKYAEPSLAAAKNIEAVFANYRKLGKLKEHIDCDIHDFTSYKYPNTQLIYVAASYQCKADFENGPATLQFTVYRFTDKVSWKIQSFNLYSPYFTGAQAR